MSTVLYVAAIVNGVLFLMDIFVIVKKHRFTSSIRQVAIIQSFGILFGFLMAVSTRTPHFLYFGEGFIAMSALGLLRKKRARDREYNAR